MQLAVDCTGARRFAASERNREEAICFHMMHQINTLLFYVPLLARYFFSILAFF
jgi:hypothetical protein